MQTTGNNAAHPSGRTEGLESHNEGIAEQAAQVRDRAAEYAGEAVETAKEHPYATLALAVGLAFAIGALWKTSSRRPSQWEGLYDQLPNWPSNWPNARSLRSYWR